MVAIAQLMPTRFSKSPKPQFIGFKKDVGDFHDPFAGTGSSFLYLANGFRGDRRIFINDANPDLVNVWRCIQEDPLKLLSWLLKYKDPSYNSQDAYQKERLVYNAESLEFSNPYCRAARMLYLIQACFNSLWRVNKSGEMNTPFGSQTQIILPTEDSLVAIAALLKNATITCQSFEKSLIAVKPNDVVYLDPPYVKVKANSHDKYTVDGFSKEQQALLRQEADRLHNLGAYVYASNSDTSLSREIWDGWKIAELTRTGCMNSDASQRQRVSELVFYRH